MHDGCFVCIWIYDSSYSYYGTHMASKKQKLKTFTCTSTEPYDRHTYKLVLKNGKAIVLQDYEHVRAMWYQYRQQLERVEVLG